MVSISTARGCQPESHFATQGFLDMPEYSIHPQSLLMETTWTCSWFERLLRLKKSGDNAPVAFADRSPFSAVYYGAHGHLLEPVIREHINEVLEQADIRIVTVHVSVSVKSSAGVCCQSAAFKL